jgi:hypothetical protein
MKTTSDMVRIQEDFTQGLLSEPALRFINIMQYRKLRLRSEIDWSGVYTTPRQGRAGCGVVVEMPAFEVLHPSVPGPVGNLVLSCVVAEEPNLNMEPETGTCLSAEAVAQFILESSHQWEIGGVGVMCAVREAIRGIARTEDPHGTVGERSLRDMFWDAQRFRGLVAYRVKLQMQAAGAALPRVALPVAQEDGVEVTLSCATDGAVMYYSMDAGFPGPGNERAVQYEGSFEMSGSVLRYAAYKPGWVRSHVGELSKAEG